MHTNSLSSCFKESHWRDMAAQTTPSHFLLAVPSLETLYTRFLISSSRSHGFPSCASLTPMVAQSSLMEEKRLNSQVLAMQLPWMVRVHKSWHSCPEHFSSNDCTHVCCDLDFVQMSMLKRWNILLHLRVHMRIEILTLSLYIHSFEWSESSLSPLHPSIPQHLTLESMMR